MPSRDDLEHILIGEDPLSFCQGKQRAPNLLETEQGHLAANSVADQLTPASPQLTTEPIQVALELGIETDGNGARFHVRQCSTPEVPAQARPSNALPFSGLGAAKPAL